MATMNPQDLRTVGIPYFLVKKEIARKQKTFAQKAFKLAVETIALLSLFFVFAYIGTMSFIGG